MTFSKHNHDETWAGGNKKDSREYLYICMCVRVCMGLGSFHSFFFSLLYILSFLHIYIGIYRLGWWVVRISITFLEGGKRKGGPGDLMNDATRSKEQNKAGPIFLFISSSLSLFWFFLPKPHISVLFLFLSILAMFFSLGEKEEKMEIEEGRLMDSVFRFTFYLFFASIPT